MSQEPAGPGGKIRPVDRIQSFGPFLQLRHIELHERPLFDVLANHVFWHIAPADALLQQDVLRAEIGQAPSLGADYAEVPALREWRAVRQHKL